MAIKNSSHKKPWESSYDAEHNVVTVNFDGVKSGWEQHWLLVSDRHWDNPKSCRRLQKKDLEWAIDNNAFITETGDTYCCMQGKWDRRKSKNDLRTEHKRADYLNALTETGIDWFEPYAPNYIFFADGNHETAILKHHEYDLLKAMTNGLNDRAGTSVLHTPYSGMVRFKFTIGGTRRTQVLWYYAHGSGGGGPVTRGVIQSNRRAVIVPDANIVTSGHIHEQWVLNIPRHRVTDAGRSYIDSQVHIQTPTYKEEYNHGKTGYHVESGRPPKPIGAQRLRFFCDVGGTIKLEVPMVFDMSPPHKTSIKPKA